MPAVRTAVATLALGAACSKSSPSGPPAAYRFLPANPELVVRIDLPRVRAWPHYGPVAKKALAGVETILGATKQHCSLDVVGEATGVIVAKRGAFMVGDLTVIATGLPKAKVTSCLATILAASTAVKLTLEDNLVHAAFGGKPIASGAILPTGELVLVARGGQGVEPAAWKTEVAHGAVAIPAWVGELDAAAPIAVRTSDETRTVIASAALGDPLVIRGKVVSPTAEAAQRDAANLKAISSYLAQGDAGTGRIEPQGTTTFADFTASGEQIGRFLGIALPTLFAPLAPPPAPADPSAPPPDCAALPAAVEQYLQRNLAIATGARKDELSKQMPTLVPALQQAFLESCKADAWAAASIECHVRNATALSRFEKCRETLEAAPRDRLDKAVTAALAPAR